jgi:hypothetical protein
MTVLGSGSTLNKVPPPIFGWSNWRQRQTWLAALLICLALLALLRVLLIDQLYMRNNWLSMEDSRYGVHSS